MNVTAGLKHLLVAAALIAPQLLSARPLPLGDGRISMSPHEGYLMSCVQGWSRRRTHGGPWIRGDEWDPAEKPHVEGEVHWHDAKLSIALRGDQRIITGNGLPDEPTGIFPIRPTDPAYRYDPNPNSIRPQSIHWVLPAHPRLAARPTCVPMGMVGIALDGASIFDAVDAGGDDAVAHEVQDSCDGHPNHFGQYHYHGPSPCMIHERTSGLVGYALDGFGIYGMRDPRTGRILHSKDLDACHGTTSLIRWDGRWVNMYHYVLTPDYPYTIGCFRGRIDPANLTMRQRRQVENPGMRMPPRRRMRRPDSRNGAGGRANAGPMQRRQRLARAARALGISPRALRRALGPPPPDLAGAAETLGIPENELRRALNPGR